MFQKNYEMYILKFYTWKNRVYKIFQMKPTKRNKVYSMV